MPADQLARTAAALRATTGANTVVFTRVSNDERTANTPRAASPKVAPPARYARLEALRHPRDSPPRARLTRSGVRGRAQLAPTPPAVLRPNRSLANNASCRDLAHAGTTRQRGCGAGFILQPLTYLLNQLCRATTRRVALSSRRPIPLGGVAHSRGHRSNRGRRIDVLRRSRRSRECV